NGDANFMATLAEARVLPEALEASYTRLKGRLGGWSDCSDRRRHADDAAVPGPQAALPGLPVAVPPRRFLRAVPRGCRARRPVAADHADVAAGLADGGHPSSRRRGLYRAADPRRPEGRALRAARGPRQGQETPQA